MQAYLDTNVVVRLAVADLKKITKPAQQAIDRYDLLFSPTVRLELQHLHEIGRLTVGAEPILSRLGATIGLAPCRIPFDAVAYAACSETWTRDSFDRLIVAHARCNANAPLLSADETILTHYPNAIW